MNIGPIQMPDGAALAPMAGVTDAPMRLMCSRMGCAWSVSEMLSAKGYIYAPDNHAHVELLSRFDGEGICGLQLFGSDETMLAEAAKRLEDRPFQFYDFNCGCPAHKIVQNGEGSALMKTPERIGRLVYALSRATEKPVTVKIRAGWDAEHINAVEVAKICEENGAQGIAVHPRTREQMYMGLSNWDIITEVKQAVKIPVIGNGDIRSGGDALRMKAQTGCDAVMVARAAQGNPWIFKEILCALTGRSYTPPTIRERVDMARQHLSLQCEWRGEYHAIPEMRKHVAWYMSGTPGSQRLRGKVNQMTTLEEVRASLDEYLEMNLNETRR